MTFESGRAVVQDLNDSNTAQMAIINCPNSTRDTACQVMLITATQDPLSFPNQADRTCFLAFTTHQVQGTSFTCFYIRFSTAASLQQIQHPCFLTFKQIQYLCFFTFTNRSCTFVSLLLQMIHIKVELTGNLILVTLL